MTNPFEVKLNTKKYAGTLYLEKDFYDDLANLGWDCLLYTSDAADE